MTLKLGIQYRVLKYYQICSNDDTRLTLIIFMIWSHLFHNASAWVKTYTAYEPSRDKTNKVTVRPAKTQISLGIHSV